MGQGIGCKIYENCGRDCTHCTAEEAKKKARKMKPRKAAVFEGVQEEMAAAKGLLNFKTHRCPVCNWIVEKKSVLGTRITNYCENCGQALETEITEE